MRIKALSPCFVCSMSLLAGGVAFAAEPAWELTPPDAKFLIGIDVRSLRSSSLADAMTAQMRSQMQSQMQLPMAMLHIPGAELLDDIDSVFIAATGDMATPARATGGKVDSTVTPDPATKSPAAKNSAAKSNPAFLVAVSGTFPDEHLRPLLTGPHPSYKGINVYRGTGANSFSIAVLDEHTVLFGDEKSIYRAIDRKSVGAKPVGPLFAHARELAAANEIWMLARDESGNLRKATGPGAEFASEFQGLDLGLALREGFNMDVSLETKTEAGAQAMSQLFSSQMQIAVGQKMDAQMAQEFWKKVKVGAEGNRIRVQIALTKEELAANIRMMQEQQASGVGPHFAKRPAPETDSASPASATVVISQPAVSQKSVSQPALVAKQPVAPPKPRVIKIYGLDDGVREVNLDRN